MIHSEGSIATDDGYNLYTQNWVPEGMPRAILLLVHGLAEHSGRYNELAEFFTADGIAVYTLDHPGHGRSDGDRCHIRNFSEFTRALDIYLAQIKDAHPDVPLILVGHSLGGLIASAFLIERQSEFAAAVLSGPAIRAPQQPSRVALFITRIIATLFPKLGLLQLDSSGVSRDPDVVRKYDDDPLVFRGKVSARLAAEVFKAMDNVIADAAKITLPTLILHGGADTLTDVEGSKLLHEKIGTTDKEITIYDGLYHEIFNEPERLAVMTNMRDWLDSRIAGAIA